MIFTFKIPTSPYNAPGVSFLAQTSPAREDYDTLLAYVQQEMTLLIDDLLCMTYPDHNHQQPFAFFSWTPGSE